MSEVPNERDDSPLLDADDDEKNVKVGEEDEMLLLSSPSSVQEEDSAAQEVQDASSEKSLTKGDQDLLTSSENILVEDSDSEENVDNSDNSVEVIDSDGDSDNDSGECVEDVESSSAYLDGKVQIFHLQGSLFIWNAEDVQMLREECRIIGKLSGCLPRAPRQNNHLGMPLQLMPEEAKLLEEIEAACVVEQLEGSEEDENLRRTAFEQTRQENFKIQQRLYKESRKEEIKQHMGDILAGKKAKKRKIQELEKSGQKKGDEPETSATDKIRMEAETPPGSDVRGDAENPPDSNSMGESKSVKGADSENVTKNVDEKPMDCPSAGDKEEEGVGGKEEEGGGGKEEEGGGGKGEGAGEAKEEAGEDKEDSGTESSEEETLDVDQMVTAETDVKHSFVQIFTETPWRHEVKRCKDWIFPLSQRDRLRYAVFRDLWRKGYYLTSGTKFGGDFLVYPGDPCKFHSHYVAICIDVSEDMSVLDLISMARLGSNVRKTALICSFNKFRQVTYLSMQWTGMA